MPASVMINQNESIILYQQDFYDIFGYVRSFINSPALEFKLYLPIDSGLDSVDVRDYTSSEFNIMYQAMVNALKHLKESGKIFRQDSDALKEWESIILALEKDKRFGVVIPLENNNSHK